MNPARRPIRRSGLGASLESARRGSVVVRRLRHRRAYEASPPLRGCVPARPHSPRLPRRAFRSEDRKRRWATDGKSSSLFYLPPITPCIARGRLRKPLASRLLRRGDEPERRETSDALPVAATRDRAAAVSARTHGAASAKPQLGVVRQHLQRALAPGRTDPQSRSTRTRCTSLFHSDRRPRPRPKFPGDDRESCRRL
jgi:hypothetical protein